MKSFLSLVLLSVSFLFLSYLSPIVAQEPEQDAIDPVVAVSQPPAEAVFELPEQSQGTTHAKVCPGRGGPDGVNCASRIAVDDKAKPFTAIAPVGYGPLQFRGAYGVSGVAAKPVIIAIVTAYDHPNVLRDLDVYSTTFGIPKLPKCSTAITRSRKPCFKKVNQRGGTSYPQYNPSWVYETALDVEVAHAMCQNCSILLVEADASTWTDLLAAVDRARILGAKIISMSWGGTEWEGSPAFDAHFNYPGIVFTASSGDSGYGMLYPAASQYVTAVGGTTLTIGPNNTYGGETAWAGSGSGCSPYQPKPSFQKDTLCAGRTVVDVSAAADPGTGAAIYVTTPSGGSWIQVGGTSLSSPLIAGIYGLGGGVDPIQRGNAALYQQMTSANIRDIVSGSNGQCGGSYLCTALAGYDGPTGLGTPNGLGAF